MFDILQKAGRGVKKFMSEKINTCKEILSSAKNRAILGAIIMMTGIGGRRITDFRLHAYAKGVSIYRKFAKITCPIMKGIFTLS